IFEWKERYGGAEEAGQRRDVAGDPRHADSENAGDGQSAWPYDRACDREHVRGRATGGAGIVVSGSAPAGGSRLGKVVVGGEREQPQGEVLRVDGGREEAAGGGA